MISGKVELTWCAQIRLILEVIFGDLFWSVAAIFEPFLAGIYLFKVNNGNTKTFCEICSKLTIETLERCLGRPSSVFIVNFKHSIPFLVFPWLFKQVNTSWVFSYQFKVISKGSWSFLECLTIVVQQYYLSKKDWYWLLVKVSLIFFEIAVDCFSMIRNIQKLPFFVWF